MIPLFLKDCPILLLWIIPIWSRFLWVEQSLTSKFKGSPLPGAKACLKKITLSIPWFFSFSNDIKLSLAFILPINKKENKIVKNFIDISTCAKSIERIGDHAKNIAQHTIYLIKGKDVRHTSIEQVRSEIEE